VNADDRHDGESFEDRFDEDAGLDDAAAFESEEEGGLGLTEEFARIEAEIQGDQRPPEAGAQEDPATEGAESEATGEGPEADEEAEPEAAEEAEPEAAEEAEPEATAPAEPEEGEETEPEATAPAEPETGEEADSEPEAGEEADVAAEEATVAAAALPTEIRRPAGQPAPARPIPRPAVPVAALEEEPGRKAPSLWLRFMAGSVLIVTSMAAAVAVAGLLLLDDLVTELRPIPGVQKQLAAVESDAPQTILIIGSDKRASDPKGVGARSDTTMLLRVDPDNEVLSLFSLPRDLKVDIPGVGPRKLNEAYTIGGAKKTLKTVAQFTGLDINHVVEINFAGFADAVNAIDCVYIDVDREYFNDNSGAAFDEQYAAIDINAGYQRLCGLKALQYVRYRHTDTDLVRSARQQDFLREARQKVAPRELIPVIGGTGNELIDIFTTYVESDISDKADVIGILKSFISVRDVPVNEVHFEGDIGGPDQPYVTSTDRQVEKAIDQFLNGVGSAGQRGGSGSNKKKGDEKEKKKEKKSKNPAEGANVVATEALADSKFPTLAERFAKDAGKNSRRLGIPVFYPTKVVPGSGFSTDSRTYEYRNEDDKWEDAYKTVIAYTTPSTLTEYYGVMGTTWDDPPILRNPSEVREIGGRDYLLFYDGGRLRMVGWRKKGNSYWLNNTLTQSVGEAEMLAMATSMAEV
jgi:LCP family protein required for cell wall assembly